MAEGMLDEYLPEKTQTYDAEAVTRELDPNTDTVKGQLTGLLAEDSDYIKHAEQKGISYANSRGLLNSSIAGGTARAAAYDAALPIAQQDASLYATQGLANQDALNTAELTNAAAKNKGALQDTVSETTIKGQGLQNKGALDVQAAQDAAAMERLNVAEEGSKERLGMEIGSREAMQEKELAERRWETEFNAESAMDLLNTQLESDEKLQAERLESQKLLAEMGYDYQKWETELKVETEKILADLQIAAQDRLQFGNYFLNRGAWVNAELARIAEHPDLTEAEKRNRIEDTKAAYIDDMQMVADLFAIPIEVLNAGGIGGGSGGVPWWGGTGGGSGSGLWFDR